MSLGSTIDWFDSLSGNLKGSLIILVAAFGFSLMVALIKLAGERYDVTQILLVRQSVMLLIASPSILLHFPGCLRSGRPQLQFLRVGLALVAMLTGFYAVIHLPLADVMAIGFAKAFFVTIFAIWILHETVGIRRWFAVILGFVGVLVMMRPGTSGFDPVSLLALFSAACAGMVMITLRLLAKHDAPITTLSYQALFVGLAICPFAYWFWVWPDLYGWLVLIAIGVVSYCAQLMNIHAYKWGEASVLASLDYVRLLYATLFGYLLFDSWPSIYTWIGAGIIISASLYTVHREHRKNRELARSPQGRPYTHY